RSAVQSRGPMPVPERCITPPIAARSIRVCNCSSAIARPLFLLSAGFPGSDQFPFADLPSAGSSDDRIVVIAAATVNRRSIPGLTQEMVRHDVRSTRRPVALEIESMIGHRMLGNGVARQSPANHIAPAVRGGVDRKTEVGLKSDHFRT